jgi:hypothetical protein
MDIQSDDGVANAAIFEASQRLLELERENAELKADNAMLRQMLDLALRIPNMSDSELKELIQICKAVNDSKELIQNCKAVNDSARKEQP